MDIAKYLFNFFSTKKLNKHISWFAFWDKSTSLPEFVYLGPTARLLDCKIGNYTRIKPGCVLKHVEIGKFCSVANNVMIGLGQHPTNLLSTNSIFYKPGVRTDFAKSIDFEEEKNIHIGHDVWIGNGAVIMDGINIGNGAIIASRAVVTKDVPPFSIVAGIPAKVIRYRFKQEIINYLEETEWWNFSEQKIIKILPIFTDTNLSIEKLKKSFEK